VIVVELLPDQITHHLGGVPLGDEQHLQFGERDKEGDNQQTRRSIFSAEKELLHWFFWFSSVSVGVLLSLCK
jgi:hypothetical protein